MLGEVVGLQLLLVMPPIVVGLHRVPFLSCMLQRRVEIGSRHLRFTANGIQNALALAADSDLHFAIEIVDVFKRRLSVCSDRSLCKTCNR